MDKLAIKLIIFAMVLMVSLVIILTVVAIEDAPELVGEIECEHEFVTTSRYNLLLGSYKTYSKCIKCGKEI